jgi:hypothetical protein
MLSRGLLGQRYGKSSGLSTVVESGKCCALDVVVVMSKVQSIPADT